MPLSKECITGSVYEGVHVGPPCTPGKLTTLVKASKKYIYIYIF